MKLEVGMYVRTKNGYIDKIISIDYAEELFEELGYVYSKDEEGIYYLKYFIETDCYMKIDVTEYEKRYSFELEPITQLCGQNVVKKTYIL